MAVLGGTGVVPSASSQQSIFLELNSLTRRAFIPRVTVQLYYSTPTLMMLLGGAQKSAGGMDQITVPVQGQSMVQGAWTGYSGSFNKPQVIPGVQNAQFNTAYFIVPVPLVLGEALIQSTEAIIPILDIRMNDVYAVTAQQMCSALFTNNTANPLMPSSFVDAFDNGTNVSTYGGINRSTQGNTFWQGQYYNFQGQNILTRSTLSNLLIQITDNAGGEVPDFVVMSPSDYAALNATFVASETVFVEPGRQDGSSKYSMDTPIRSSFPNIVIAGIPFYMDHWCPKGSMYFVNSKYTAMYLSEDAPFVFSGFYSTIPIMQLAQVGVMVVGYQIVCTKPLSCAVVTNFTGGAF